MGAQATAAHSTEKRERESPLRVGCRRALTHTTLTHTHVIPMDHRGGGCCARDAMFHSSTSFGVNGFALSCSTTGYHFGRMYEK